MFKRLPKKSSKRIALVYSLLPLANMSCQDFSAFIRPQPSLPVPFLESFDIDSQGWKLSSGAKGGHSQKGGHPGGYVYGIDNAAGAWFFLASDSLLHESKKGYGKTLRFELEQDAADEQVTTTDDVVLSDGVVTLTYNTSCNPATTWTTYSVKFDELSGWKKGKKDATKADLQQVLVNLKGLKIRGEFRVGPDRGGIDNVSLN